MKRLLITLLIVFCLLASSSAAASPSDRFEEKITVSRVEDFTSYNTDRVRDDLDNVYEADNPSLLFEGGYGELEIDKFWEVSITYVLNEPQENSYVEVYIYDFSNTKDSIEKYVRQKDVDESTIETQVYDELEDDYDSHKDTGVDLVNGWVAVEIILARTESELDGTRKGLTIVVDGVTTFNNHELFAPLGPNERSWNRVKFIGTGSIDNIEVEIPRKPFTQGFTWLLIGSLATAAVVAVGTKFDIKPFNKQGFLRTQARRVLK